MALHLDKLAQIDIDLRRQIMLEHQTILNSALEVFSAKLLQMLSEIFKTSGQSTKAASLHFKDFNLRAAYTNGELFNFLNDQTNTQTLFSVLMRIFSALYLKSSTVNSSLTFSKQAKAPTLATSLSQVAADSNKEIKNIDDPSSDEEDNAESKYVQLSIF